MYRKIQLLGSLVIVEFRFKKLNSTTDNESLPKLVLFGFYKCDVNVIETTINNFRKQRRNVKQQAFDLFQAFFIVLKKSTTEIFFRMRCKQ